MGRVGENSTEKKGRERGREGGREGGREVPVSTVTMRHVYLALFKARHSAATHRV